MNRGQVLLVNKVCDHVSLAWNRVTEDAMSRHAILSKTGIMNVVICRHITCFILREHYKLSCSRIGKAMRMHHSSVSTATRNFKNTMEFRKEDVLVYRRALETLNVAKDVMQGKEKPESLYKLMDGTRRRNRELMMKVVELKNEVEKLRRALRLARKSDPDNVILKPNNWSEDELKRLRAYRSKGATVAMP